MNNTISITYDKSPKDLTALTSFVFSKDENVLQMKVGYVGSNAEEIIKIVTEQGYIDIIKENVRADAIEEYKDKLLELCDCRIGRAGCTGRRCLKCIDNAVDYSSIIDLAEELKEKKV